MTGIMANPGLSEARGMPQGLHGNTVTFLPHRLNRVPVIVLGLTADELWITASFSAAVGLSLGVVAACLLRSFAVAPTVMVIAIAMGVYLGGRMLRRLKRGRPETWAYRQLQWWLSRRFPFIRDYVGGRELLTRSGYWTTRRSVRVRPVARVTRP